jgi:hypothetical protein
MSDIHTFMKKETRPELLESIIRSLVAEPDELWDDYQDCFCLSLGAGNTLTREEVDYVNRQVELQS